VPHVVSTNDSYFNSVIGLPEKHENGKFTGKHGRYNSTALREPIHQEILLKRYTLLPFTIAPGGQIGPLAATSLWPHSHQPITTIHSTNRSTTNLSLPLANQLFNTSSAAYSNFGLLRKANIGWNKEHKFQWFARSHTAMLPSHWASKVFNQNLTLAFSKHIQTSISKLNQQPSPSSRKFLNTAALTRQYPKSTIATSSAYFIAFTLTGS
jgi:hypothetical protein